MVSQHYLIRRINLEEDSPDYEDQDLNLPWYANLWRICVRHLL